MELALKILQIATRPQRRGAEVFCYQLTQELRRTGHDARIAYLYPHDGESPLPLEEADVELAGRADHVCERFPGVNPRLVRRLARHIQGFGPQVVQVNGSRTVKYGSLVGRLTRPRPWALIYRNIGHLHEWVKGPLRRGFYRLLVMPGIDGVVGVSRTTLASVEELYGLDVPSRHIPRGVDARRLESSESRRQVRRQTKTAVDAPVVIALGSLTPEKRLDRLLRVVARASREVADLNLWVVGDGPLAAELRRQAESLGLAARVRFLGARAEVGPFLRASDVLLLTSDTEGLPGVVLEAGIAGVPAVVSRVGGSAESVRDGETGILVPPGDEDRFARELVALLSDPPRRQALGRRARAWVEANFTLPEIARRYVDFYDAVLRERGVSRARTAPEGKSLAR